MKTKVIFLLCILGLFANNAVLAQHQPMDGFVEGFITPLVVFVVAILALIIYIVVRITSDK